MTPGERVAGGTLLAALAGFVIWLAAWGPPAALATAPACPARQTLTPVSNVLPAPADGGIVQTVSLECQ